MWLSKGRGSASSVLRQMRESGVKPPDRIILGKYRSEWSQRAVVGEVSLASETSKSAGEEKKQHQPQWSPTCRLPARSKNLRVDWLWRDIDWCWHTQPRLFQGALPLPGSFCNCSLLHSTPSHFIFLEIIFLSFFLAWKGPRAPGQRLRCRGQGMVEPLIGGDGDVAHEKRWGGACGRQGPV